jgi:hypothetical protein
MRSVAFARRETNLKRTSLVNSDLDKKLLCVPRNLETARKYDIRPRVTRH